MLHKATEYAKKAEGAGTPQEASLCHLLAAEKFMQAAGEAADPHTRTALSILSDDQNALGRLRQVESRALTVLGEVGVPVEAAPSPTGVIEGYFDRAAVQRGLDTVHAAHTAVTALGTRLDAMKVVPPRDPAPAPAPPPMEPRKDVSPEVARLLDVIQRLGAENETLLQQRIEAAQVKKDAKAQRDLLTKQLEGFRVAFRAKLAALQVAMSTFRRTCLQSVTHHVAALKKESSAPPTAPSASHGVRAVVDTLFPAPVVPPVGAEDSALDVTVRRLLSQLFEARGAATQAEERAARLDARVKELEAELLVLRNKAENTTTS